MSMVTAIKFYDFVLPGHTPRQAYGRHHRFSTRTYKSNLLNVLMLVEDEASQLIAQSGWGTKRGSVLHRFDNPVSDPFMIVSQYKGTPGATEIDVCMIVFTGDFTAIALLDEEWRATHRFEGSHRRIHSSGKILFRGLKESG